MVCPLPSVKQLAQLRELLKLSVIGCRIHQLRLVRFSGTGAPYSRGAITATDYARGIVAGSSMAVSAGGSLAQGVVQGITIGGGGVLGGATLRHYERYRRS